MKLRKLIFIVLAVIMASMLPAYAGCNPSGNGSEITDPDELDLNVDPNIEANLRIAVMNEEGEIKAIEALEEGFNKLYPNVTFRNQKVTNYEQTIMGDVAGGVVYDVIWVADQYVTLFADEGLLQNLDPFMEKANFDTSLYYESVIKLGQYMHNGSQYFLPRDYDKIVCYINTGIFKKYNIPIPQNGWTWSDFMDTCAKLYEAGCNYNANKQYAVEVDFDWRILMHTFSSSYNGTIVDENGNAVLDRNFQDSIAEMHKLIDKGYATYSQGIQQNFVSGRTAMRFQTRPYAQTYYAGLKGDLEAVAFPRIVSGVEGAEASCGAGTTGYGITRASTQKVIAWKFIEYMMSADGMERMSQSGAIVPSNKTITEDPNATWRTALPINAEAFVYSGTKDVIYDFYDMLDSVKMTGYDSALQNMLTKYFSRSDLDITSAVQTCKRDISNFLRDQGY